MTAEFPYAWMLWTVVCLFVGAMLNKIWNGLK